MPKINKPQSAKKTIKPRLKSDALFKSIMTNKTAAEEFLQEYLPDEIKAIVNLSEINIEKESYVESHLKRQLSDIVYSIKTKDDVIGLLFIDSLNTSLVPIIS